MKPFNIFWLIRAAKYDTTGDDIDYKIVVVEGRPVLLFQESTSKRDWKNNFNFPRKLYKDQESPIRVHRGYGNAWKTANDKIIGEFISACLLNDGEPLIAGWSFGGAMALLAAEDLYYRAKIKAEVMTFGAPKIAGDRRTVKTFRNAGNIKQYAHVNDVVPMCPPFPCFHHINKIKCGKGFNPFKLFQPNIYHYEYSKETIYAEEK